MKTPRRLILSALLAAACLALLCAPAAAYTRVDTSAQTSLTLVYRDAGRQDRPLAGMALRLYLVAELDETARFHTTAAFAPAQVDLSGSDWSAAAATLAAYARRNADSVHPAAEGVTDSEGRLSAQLPVGLYLVAGDRLADGGYSYTPTPYLLTLPLLDRERDLWQYDVTVGSGLKYTREDPGPVVETFSIHVRKVWAEDDSTQRPGAVTVTLLRDGAVYASTRLDAGNDWQYTWRGLNARWRYADWALTEDDVPDGYTVLVEQEGSSSGIYFTVTNTGFTTPEPTPSPSPSVPPEEPTPSPSTPPEEPTPTPGGSPEPSPSLPPEPEEPDLPQTGLLWWPVELLAGTGLLLTVGGCILLRRGRGGRNEP